MVWSNGSYGYKKPEYMIFGLVRHLVGYMPHEWLGLSNPCRVWGTLNVYPKRKKESEKTK